MTTLLVCLLLATAPPAQVGSSAEADPARGELADAGEFEEALARLRRAGVAVNDEPEAADSLLAAIVALNGHGPTLAADPEALQLRALSQMVLARTYLISEREDAAAATMDEAIRSAMGGALPADELGPRLAEFHERRMQALTEAGFGALTLRCRDDCHVYVNERAVEVSEQVLYRGIYRVWIEDAAGQHPPLRRSIEVGEKPVTIDYAPEQILAPPTPEAERRPARVMPRWAKITLLTTGIGMLAGAGALWAYDRTACANGEPQCRVRRTAVPAMAVAGIGGGLLLSGVVTLSVAEVRGQRGRGVQAGVSWTMRF